MDFLQKAFDDSIPSPPTTLPPTPVRHPLDHCQGMGKDSESLQVANIHPQALGTQQAPATSASVLERGLSCPFCALAWQPQWTLKALSPVFARLRSEESWLLVPHYQSSHGEGLLDAIRERLFTAPWPLPTAHKTCSVGSTETR